MKNLMLVLLLSLFIPTPASAELTPKEAANLLINSVVELNNKSCTAAKIGPYQYLTAKHCVSSKMKLASKSYSMWAKSVLMAWQDKAKGNRKEDWAIINTATDTDDIKALTLGCNEEIYLGMRVAYAGYPNPTEFSFGMGAVTSLLPSRNRKNNLDYMMDVHAAPGASGSPVISMETGYIIGILTEGVINGRIGAFMVGFESIKGLDLCDFSKEDVTRYGIKGSTVEDTSLATPF